MPSYTIKKAIQFPPNLPWHQSKVNLQQSLSSCLLCTQATQVNSRFFITAQHFATQINIDTQSPSSHPTINIDMLVLQYNVPKITMSLLHQCRMLWLPIPLHTLQRHTHLSLVKLITCDQSPMLVLPVVRHHQWTTHPLHPATPSKNHLSLSPTIPSHQQTPDHQQMARLPFYLATLVHLQTLVVVLPKRTSTSSTLMKPPLTIQNIMMPLPYFLIKLLYLIHMMIFLEQSN